MPILKERNENYKADEASILFIFFLYKKVHTKREKACGIMWSMAKRLPYILN